MHPELQSCVHWIAPTQSSEQFIVHVCEQALVPSQSMLQPSKQLCWQVDVSVHVTSQGNVSSEHSRIHPCPPWHSATHEPPLQFCTQLASSQKDWQPDWAPAQSKLHVAPALQALLPVPFSPGVALHSVPTPAQIWLMMQGGSLHVVVTSEPPLAWMSHAPSHTKVQSAPGAQAQTPSHAHGPPAHSVTPPPPAPPSPV